MQMSTITLYHRKEKEKLVVQIGTGRQSTGKDLRDLRNEQQQQAVHEETTIFQ